MPNIVFLGEYMSEDVKEFFIKTFGQNADNSIYALYKSLLEDYENKSAELPAAGSYILIPYLIDPTNGTVVDIECLILGYNASIPEYVKYKNGKDIIFVSSVKSGLLANISANDVVYNENDGIYTANGLNVSSIGSETFTYGNNCTYSVPKTIIVNNKTYTFAGYNMTLNTRGILSYVNGELIGNTIQFDYGRGGYNYGQNDYSTSVIRQFLNGKDKSRLEGVTMRHNVEYSHNDVALMTIDKITTINERFSAIEKYVIPIVNRTWIHSNFTSGKILDSNQCEHIIDKFWLLGIGNINCNGKYSSTTYYYDNNYDTNKFSNIWPTDKYVNTTYTELCKQAMNADGTLMPKSNDNSTDCHYWLRSAYQSSSSDVGTVYYDGNVSDYDAYYDAIGCSPAFTI